LVGLILSHLLGHGFVATGGFRSPETDANLGRREEGSREIASIFCVRYNNIREMRGILKSLCVELSII
jgi:hypothetical protein